MGPRGMPARPFARVDESAMQAKLQELKVAMAREKVARDTARGVMEAGGGRMWRSSAPRPRELRDRRGGGPRLRELSAEELERIQRARERSAEKERAALLAAATAGRARSHSGRRLDPLHLTLAPSSASGTAPPGPRAAGPRAPQPAPARPSSAARSRPASPAIEHVVIRAPSSVYAPPAGPRRAPPPGAHAPPLERPQPPRAPAPPPGPPRSTSARRPRSAAAAEPPNVAPRDEDDEDRAVTPPDDGANDAIEPMGDFDDFDDDDDDARSRIPTTTRPRGGASIRLANRRGDADVLILDGDDDRGGRRLPSPALRAEERATNETSSLLDGSFDEEANRRAFQEALREWRGGGGPGEDEGGGGRGGGAGGGDAKRANANANANANASANANANANAPPAAAMETQTDAVSAPTEALSARRGAARRPATAKKGASYFQRLYAENAERMAAKDAIDAMGSRRRS